MGIFFFLYGRPAGYFKVWLLLTLKEQYDSGSWNGLERLEIVIYEASEFIVLKTNKVSRKMHSISFHCWRMQPKNKKQKS